MNSQNRFYIITGKGGVGKTLASFALTNALIQKGKKAKYLVFKSNKLENKRSDNTQAQFDLPIIELDLLDCATEYVARKMKSETIAKWVVKTPFFKALINMLPGFSYLIYLGKTIDLLQKDPELVLVLDSPSSGHALTMLESTVNYQEIFQSGSLFEDTQKVINKLYEESFTKALIITLPTQMALNESRDLKEEIHKIKPIETEIICNNVMSQIKDLNIDNLPKILKDKIANEKEVISQFSDLLDHSLTYISENQSQDIMQAMSKEMEQYL